MQLRNPFTCFILGEGTLPVQCAEILFHRGHKILGVISPDKFLRDWAEPHTIPTQNPSKPEEILWFLQQQPFDYLFSIVNYLFLPEIMADLPWWNASNIPLQVDQALYAQFRKLPRLGTINYHDGPLPKYAGFYTTSWAIMNQETRHGVSWHWMDEKVDSGGIIVQNKFDISPDETALTLNAKCYEAAIQSFTLVVEGLEAGAHISTQQDIEQRSYFPLNLRPRDGCVINWEMSAEQIYAMARGLDFGTQPNPIGLPKLLIGNELFIVPKIGMLDKHSDAPPGTITKISESSIMVSTLTKQITFEKVLTVDGDVIPISRLIEQHNLSENYRFANLDNFSAEQLTTLCELLSRHEFYWIKQLSQLNRIEMPYISMDKTNRNMTPTGSNNFFHISLPIPDHVQAVFIKLTPAWLPDIFMVAALTGFLARVSGQYSFDIGLATPEIRTIIQGFENFFSEFVPLHVDLRSDINFLQVYDTILNQIKQVRNRITYPRDSLARHPQINSTKLFAQPSHEQSFWSVAVRIIEDTPHHCNTLVAPLTISISRQIPESCWTFDGRFFDQRGAEQMVSQFTTSLNNLAKDWQKPLRYLSLLSEAEKFELIVNWNNTAANFPPESQLHKLFEAQVEKTPEAIAVIEERNSLTYEELNHLSNQLAHLLINFQVKPETLVGICVERSLDMVIALIATLKAGGAYIPMDPSYPAERLDFMLKSSQAPVLLTHAALMSHFSEYSGKIVCLDSDKISISEMPSGNPSITVHEDNPAYVIFTSGSTGIPKGAMLTHRSICNHMHWMMDEFPLKSCDAVLQKTPFSFDASVWEFYAPLISGARLVLARHGGHVDTEYLIRLINHEKVTILQLVPTLLSMLLEDEGFKNCNSLRRVFCGGEVLPARHVNHFHRTLPNSDLFNLYGPTEATIDALIWKCDRNETRQNIPLGKPIANLHAYILDNALQPLPVGITGDLYLGGAGLGRGYHKSSRMTAERFLPNPYGKTPGERIYKTGDRASYLPDGSIEFQGRSDFQVKIRGQRIELGEIETVLVNLAKVNDAVVIAREDTPGDVRLAAYIVLDTRMDQLPSPGDIHKLLATRLPDYMLPSDYVILSSLPLTPNGKIDRQALPVPERDVPVVEGEIAPISNALQESLVQIWSHVLGYAKVGVNHNFFTIGGNSLLATQVVSRIRKTYQVNVPLSSFFNAPTIADLALRIEEAIIDEIERIPEDEF